MNYISYGKRLKREHPQGIITLEHSILKGILKQFPQILIRKLS